MEILDIPRFRVRQAQIEIKLKSRAEPWFSGAPKPELLEELKRRGLAGKEYLKLPVWGEADRGAMQDWLSRQGSIIGKSAVKGALKHSVEKALSSIHNPGIVSYRTELPAVAAQWVEELYQLSSPCGEWRVPKQEQRALDLTHPLSGSRAIISSHQDSWIAIIISMDGQSRVMVKKHPEQIIAELKTISGTPEISATLPSSQLWITNNRPSSPQLQLKTPQGLLSGAQVIRPSRLAGKTVERNYFARPAIVRGVEMSADPIRLSQWQKMMSHCSPGGIIHLAGVPRRERIPRPNQLTLLYRPENPYLQ